MYTKKSSHWLKVALDDNRERFVGSPLMTSETHGDSCPSGLGFCVTVRKQDLELWQAAGIIDIF